MGVVMQTPRLWIAISGAVAVCAALLAVPLSAAINQASADSAARSQFAIDKDVRTAEETFAAVSKLARELSQRPYLPGSRKLPAAFENLDYDAYRRLRPRSEAAVWKGETSGYEVLPLPRGGLFRSAVQMHLVDDKGVKRIVDAKPYVEATDFPAATPDQLSALGFSGWRLLKASETASPDAPQVGADEYAVFQGGSYFRAISDGLAYGLSARALSVGTASAAGEEFPEFTAFWIIKPEAGDAAPIEAVGLLDSESISGAVRFKVIAGAATVFDVQADFYPRKEIAEVGVAPMSSMFYHGSADPKVEIADYRPEVHDSDGLLIRAASGEHIWRPVTNPRRLEVSTFELGEVAGFGLMQRRRDFASYADLEAAYERRPSLWVEPVSGWDGGNVVLVEIPTRDEYNDNIVALWRPAEVWKPSEKRSLSYRLHWTDVAPAGQLATVASTRIGDAPAGAGAQRFVVDFTGDADALFGDDVTLDVWSSTGEIQSLHSTAASAQNLRRIVFDLDAKGADVVELHAALRAGNRQISETWLYRWTPE